jgi:hypothetical protein
MATKVVEWLSLAQTVKLKLLKSNLHRAGVLGPNREKSLAHQIAEL